MRCYTSIFSILAAYLAVFTLVGASFAAVEWVAPDSEVPLEFEEASHWDPSDYDPPPPNPEETPPGSDSVWFIGPYEEDDMQKSFDGSIILSQPRTAETSKLGPGRIGGGLANEVIKLYIDTDVTITGQERDDTGAVNPDLREMRIGGDDLTPGDENFPLGMVIQRAGHVHLEYENDPEDSDLKLVSDKEVTGGAVWEVGGTAQLTLHEGLLIGEKSGVTATGGIFRVRGSDVEGVNIGNRLLALSRSSTWDLEEVVYNEGTNDEYSAQRVRRGKSIVEFVLDENGVTPIEIDGDLSLGSEFTDIFSNPPVSYVVPGFLRVKISEPTMAGSGDVDSGDEEVLVIADNIDSRIMNPDFEGSQTQAGVFYDPDRETSTFPHRIVAREGGTVVSEYAGVTYTWDAVYDDNSMGLETLENAFTLTNLTITDPGGSGIQGDFDDANGLDVADANALQAAFGTEIGFADAQHMFDLNADNEINADDLMLLVTHPGFANSTMADFDLDGSADQSDLATLEANYGMASGALFTDGDTDLDGDVDGLDFLAWQRNVAGAAAALASVPEPTTGLLLTIACGTMFCRRRRA